MKRQKDVEGNEKRKRGVKGILGIALFCNLEVANTP